MNNKIRIGLFGCGAFTELYYSSLIKSVSESENVETVFLFDPDATRLAALKEIFPKAKISTNFAAFADAKLDLGIVASPPKFHAEQSIGLLRAGVAVLCEKPMAATVAEAEAMNRAAAESGSLLAVGLFRRFFSTSGIVREVVRNERLGKVLKFELSEGGPFNWQARSASFFQRSGSQGGVLADLGVHVLDLLISWFGMPTAVKYSDDAMGGLEANCLVDLEFPKGISGTVRLSRDTQLPNRTWILCENGWLGCDAANSDSLEIGFPESDFSVKGGVTNAGAGGWLTRDKRAGLTFSQSFAAQLQNVIDAIRGTEQLLIPGEQGILSQRLIETCYSQRSLMSMPWLSKPEYESARKLSTANSLSL